MKIRKFNIVNPKKYGQEDSDGKQKTFWANVGTLTEFHKEDGTVNRIIEMNDSNVQFQVFENEPKENQDGGNRQQEKPAVRQRDNSPIEYPSEDINPSDIPF